ncbi:MAG: regulatory protein RecX [Clostridia bacterium]|nr:regulatory protein RecX [Clostridia bacterium]
MKITSKPGNGNKVHIYIDGEYTLTLYDDYWYRAGYSEDQEISDDELASLKEEAGFRSAYEKGITYLSMRAYSRKELFNKLKLKYGAEASERAIQKMEGYGYIDDEAFCRQYARHLFEGKKYDVKRISYELKLKGVDSEIIDNTLKTLDNEPIQRIIDMLRTKYEKNLDSPKEVKRIFNRFVRMGYSFGDIKSAFEEIGIEIPVMR